MQRIQFKAIFDKMYPTPLEQEKATEFIKQATQNWHEWYLKNRPRQRGRLILKYFMMPKTDLHKEFKEKICIPDRDAKIEIYTKIKKDEMAQGKQDFQTRDYSGTSPSGWEYERMGRFSTTDDNFIRIWIPYKKNNFQESFSYYSVVLISQKETPRLYLLFM